MCADSTVPSVRWIRVRLLLHSKRSHITSSAFWHLGAKHPAAFTSVRSRNRRWKHCVILESSQPSCRAHCSSRVCTPHTHRHTHKFTHPPTEHQLLNFPYCTRCCVYPKVPRVFVTKCLNIVPRTCFQFQLPFKLRVPQVAFGCGAWFY